MLLSQVPFTSQGCQSVSQCVCKGEYRRCVKWFLRQMKRRAYGEVRRVRSEFSVSSGFVFSFVYMFLKRETFQEAGLLPVDVCNPSALNSLVFRPADFSLSGVRAPVVELVFETGCFHTHQTTKTTKKKKTTYIQELFNLNNKGSLT